MPKTFLFYDLETTGRNHCFDQILQFAAIRTDLELNEIERYEIQIKLNPDFIPDPEALLIHKIPIQTMQQGLNEFEAIQKIYAIVNTPETISGGYNTLSFDDEFLRFAFYRNLLPPYTHQYANGCGRFDLYPITILYHLYFPQVLNWPQIENKPTLKLEHLNQANQLAGGMAHNAMADVEATLELAKRLFSNRSMWGYAIDSFNKNIDQQRIEKLTQYRSTQVHSLPLALIVGQSSAQDFFLAPVLFLGYHNHYKNQTLWLRLDKSELTQITATSVAEFPYVVRKKQGEKKLVLPFIDKYSHYLSEERNTIIQNNINWLQQNLELLNELKHYHKEFKYPIIEHADIETNLYQNGFLTATEENLCRKFHQSKHNEMSKIAVLFANPNLHELSIRILGRHYPEHCPAPLYAKYQNYLDIIQTAGSNTSILDYRGNQRLTPHAALEKIKNLTSDTELTSETQILLSDLTAYIETNFPNFKMSDIL